MAVASRKAGPGTHPAGPPGAWDLTGLLTDMSGRDLAGLLNQATDDTGDLSRYSGSLNGLRSKDLAQVLCRLERTLDAVLRVQAYVELSSAAGLDDAASVTARESIEVSLPLLAPPLLGLLEELSGLPEPAVLALRNEPGLEASADVLLQWRTVADSRLSLSERRVLNEKATTGRDAWVALYDKLLSSLQVRLGEEQPLEAAFALLSDPDADRRREASQAISESLIDGLDLRAHVFDTVAADCAVDDRLHGGGDRMHRVAAEGGVSIESAAALIAAVRDRYDLAHRWFGVKRKLLGLARLTEADRLAPVPKMMSHVTWAEAVNLVLGGYDSVSSLLGERARLLLTLGRVDAQSRPGKREGSFCAFAAPSVGPFIHVTFTGCPNDVVELAHELGHGVHALLANGQPIVGYVPPPPLAETAAVFGEAAVLGHLPSRWDDGDCRTALLAMRVDAAVTNVFRSVAMLQFEELAYAERRRGRMLSADRLCELWLLVQQEMLGDAVEVSEEFGVWWSSIRQFVAAPGAFLSYPYGWLLASSLYARHSHGDADAVPALEHMLRAGGSGITRTVARDAGCDIENPGFWHDGLDLLERDVALLEQL